MHFYLQFVKDLDKLLDSDLHILSKGKRFKWKYFCGLYIILSHKCDQDLNLFKLYLVFFMDLIIIKVSNYRYFILCLFGQGQGAMPRVELRRQLGQAVT